MKKKNLIPIVLMVIAVALEALPFGAVLRFGQENGETPKSFFSYFSLTPYGYANFFPLITAVLSCVLLVLSVVLLFVDSRKCKKAFRVLAVVNAAASLIALAWGNFTVVAALILLVLAANLVISFKIYKV